MSTKHTSTARNLCIKPIKLSSAHIVFSPKPIFSYSYQFVTSCPKTAKYFPDIKTDFRGILETINFFLSNFSLPAPGAINLPE